MSLINSSGWDDDPSSDGYIGRSPEGIAGRLGSGPALGPLLFVHRSRAADSSDWHVDVADQLLRVG
jgi:hypothetical protein